MLNNLIIFLCTSSFIMRRQNQRHFHFIHKNWTLNAISELIMMFLLSTEIAKKKKTLPQTT